MQVFYYALIATAFPSIYGMASIDALKKIDSSSLTQEDRNAINANDRAKNIFSEFERIKKISSEKTLENSYKILGFDRTKISPQRAPLEAYREKIGMAGEKIAWALGRTEVIDFIKMVQDLLLATYREAATTLKDTALIESIFYNLLKNKYSKSSYLSLLDIYYTYEFFEKKENIPDEVFIATIMLFPETSSSDEQELSNRTGKEIVSKINNILKENPIKTAKDWVDVWGKFFTDSSMYKIAILLNNVSYQIQADGIKTLIDLAAKQLIGRLVEIENSQEKIQYHLNLLKKLHTSIITGRWWAAMGKQYFTSMLEGMLIMPLILKAGKSYYLATEWSYYFPQKTIEEIARLTKEALAIAEKSGNAVSRETLKFQNKLVQKMADKFIGITIAELKKENPDRQGEKLLAILNAPENVAAIVYQNSRADATTSEMNKTILEILENPKSTGSLSIPLAHRISNIDKLTRSKALTENIFKRAQEILLFAFAESLQALQKAATHA